MRIVAALALLLLSACGFTPEGSIVRTTTQQVGAQAYDEGLENSLWFICHAASIGSIRRRFGASVEQAAAYNVMCSPGVSVIEPKRP